MTYTTRTTCRCCGSADLTPLFGLGEQFVSDFVEPGRERSGLRVPIDIDLCNACTLVQQRHTAPQEFLYTRHYWYRSGVTETMRTALADVVRAACSMVTLESGDVVLDIGANDGTLLSFLPSFCVKVACEPANNMQEQLAKVADVVIPEFWSAEAYVKAEGVQAQQRDEAKNEIGSTGPEAAGSPQEEAKRSGKG